MCRLILVGAAGLCVAATPNPVLDLVNQAVTLVTGYQQRRVVDKLAENLTPADFVTIGQTETQLRTGAIDAQPAITALLAAGGSTVPCGTYRLDRTLFVTSKKLQAVDKQCVAISLNFATGDGIVVNGFQAAVSEISVQPGVARTSGSAIHVQGTSDYFSAYGARLHGIIIKGAHPADGIAVDRTVITHIDDYDCQPPAGGSATNAGGCIHLINGAVDTFIGNGNAANYRAGLQFTSGSGIYVTHVDNFADGYGVLFDPSQANGDRVYGVNMTDVLGDTTVGHAWLFAGDGPITDVQLNSPWASSSVGGNGMLLTNMQLNGVTLNGPHVLGNNMNGILVAQGKNVGISNAVVTDNGLGSTAPTYDGIVVLTTADQVRILGGMSGTGGTYSSAAPGPAKPPTHRYGVNLASISTGDTRAISVIGMQFVGNLSGTLNGPSGTNIVAIGNSTVP